MDYSGEGASVYAEAKGEYTRQLCQYLAPSLQKYFLELLDLAKEREKDAKKHLISFQTLLENISEWNVDKVQRETQAIAIGTQCDYLEELLTAVFIAHTKVLSAIRLTNRQKKLQITIPKLEHFLHRTLTECARLLWTNTFLFATTGTALERQKNMRQIEGLITEGILQGVRTMLPVKSILREYLTTESDTEVEDDEDEEAETLPPEEVPAVAAGPLAPVQQDLALAEEEGSAGPSAASEDVSGAAVDLSGAAPTLVASPETGDLEEANVEDADTKSIPLEGSLVKKPKSTVHVEKSKTPPASPKRPASTPPSPKASVPMINLDEETPHVSFVEDLEELDPPEAPAPAAAASRPPALPPALEEPLSMEEDAEPLEEEAAPSEEEKREDDLGIEFEELS